MLKALSGISVSAGIALLRPNFVWVMGTNFKAQLKEAPFFLFGFLPLSCLPTQSDVLLEFLD